ncbi:hypothetical protein NPIL_251631 [Nephila pilipes]|uniref:Uncharacterized protein n=1 Tax=Nephila pilipes TaxID=299642 RepID=A0A8X6MRL5_NEPPI|nr:hypothetical protein NPIL_251631 [Nephila pilipes]
MRQICRYLYLNQPKRSHRSPKKISETYSENFVDVFSESFLFTVRVGPSAHEVIDGVDNVREHLLGNTTVRVQVVQTESPIQLVSETAATDHGEAFDEFLWKKKS